MLWQVLPLPDTVCLLASPDTENVPSKSQTALHRVSPNSNQLHVQQRNLRQPPHLQNVAEILADGGHVICSLKQPLSVKLPPSSSPRSLDLGPGVEIGLFPHVEGVPGL